ncbi:MAG: two-component system, OmpR family, response regulator RpaA [Acidobacteriota bacterium]|jgi:CheY-like chemotaxis protein|nr:two-component system, OmpR family, response regulator RpaA [Acidobacteriota bacterium]
MEKSEKRILVVDDDDAIRALLFTILRRRGYAVDTARNGVEAVERLESCSYTLMLLDLMMPQMSGWEVLKHIDQVGTSRPTPVVIVLTAGNEPRDLNPAYVAGTVRKPFDVELLVDTITACIATQPERSQLDNCPQPDSAGEEKSDRPRDDVN